MTLNYHASVLFERKGIRQLGYLSWYKYYTTVLQCYITCTMLHYTHNVTLHAQCYITCKMLHYMQNVTLHAQCYITCTMLHYMHNVILHAQCYITCTMLYYMYNAYIRFMFLWVVNQKSVYLIYIVVEA
jgi:hypothetical protein